MGGGYFLKNIELQIAEPTPTAIAIAVSFNADRSSEDNQRSSSGRNKLVKYTKIYATANTPKILKDHFFD